MVDVEGRTNILESDEKKDLMDVISSVLMAWTLINAPETPSLMVFGIAVTFVESRRTKSLDEGSIPRSSLARDNGTMTWDAPESSNLIIWSPFVSEEDSTRMM